MLFFLITSAVICAGVLIWAWVKFVYWLLPKKKQENTENPYIHSHLMRRANDKAYDEYLDWLDKNNGSLPIEKLKTREELKFEREINKSF